MPSYEDLISGRSALTTIRNDRARRPARARPGRARQRGPRRMARQSRRAWSPAPAARSAPSSAGRSRASGRRSSCCSTSRRPRSTRSRRRSTDAFPQLPLATVVGDVKHAALVEEVLARERPSVIFHAAAYKHVPLMEETNAWQAVRNNAYGTWVLARAAVAAQGREVRAGVDRQGGEPDQRDGRDQAPRRDRLPEPAGRRHAVRARALRQRVRQRRQRDPALLASRSRAAAR